MSQDSSDNADLILLCETQWINSIALRPSEIIASSIGFLLSKKINSRRLLGANVTNITDFPFMWVYSCNLGVKVTEFLMNPEL